MAPDPVRWGILSTARINEKLLPGLMASGAATAVAVASRSAGAAERYAREKGIPRAHGSYEDLLADPEVEAVYIPLPNSLHVPWTIAALEAGKHVLCEKPLAWHVADAERCFDAAERAGLVLSEGFMWRHHPQTARLLGLIAAGAVGDVRLIRAAFSFPLGRAKDVRWDPGLHGGALLDVGCYCVSAARLLAGEPEAVTAAATWTEARVDSRFAGTLRFAGGAVLATFDCGFDLPGRGSLDVVGATGTLRLADPWHVRQPGIELIGPDGAPRHVEIPAADSYRLELEDVSGAIRDGRPPRLGRADALGQARVLEDLLAAAGPPRAP